MKNIMVVIGLVTFGAIGAAGFFMIVDEPEPEVSTTREAALEAADTDETETSDSAPVADPIPETVEVVEETVLPDEPPVEPNVLLIILDDIGLDYFPGFLEDEDFMKAPMPIMESLAEQGFRFTNLNTYAVCSPTRASLLTGHHGIETGVLGTGGQSGYLDPSWQSLQAEITSLSDGTIASAIFGKWHLMSRNSPITHPNEFVDHYAGMPTGNLESYSAWTKTTNGVQTESDVYATTDFTNAALNWINDQDSQWFAWLAYTAPHSPIHLPPAALHSQSDLSGTEQDLRRNRDAYFIAMLESVDTEIGRLLASMDAGTRENTYVLVIGDNGTGGQVAQEPYASVGVKGTLHAGGIHAPMVVYSPYQNGSNTEVESLVSTIDFYPTILDIFGLTTERDLPGNSFYPLIADSKQNYLPNEFIFSQTEEAATVRSLTHRLIRTNEGAEELFALTSDPFEEEDLLARTQLQPTDQVAYAALSDALDTHLELGN